MWKDRCGEPGGLSMFPRVSSYLDWIHENKEPVITPSPSKTHDNNIIGTTNKETKVNELKFETAHEQPFEWWANVGHYYHHNQAYYYPNIGLSAPNRYGYQTFYPNYFGPYFGLIKLLK